MYSVGNVNHAVRIVGYFIFDFDKKKENQLEIGCQGRIFQVP